MIARGSPFNNDQDILAYFTRPTCSVNYHLISEIRNETKHRSVKSASDEDLDAFLAKWPDIDSETGLSVRGDELLINRLLKNPRVRPEDGIISVVEVQLELQPGLQGAEGDLAMAVGADDHHRGLDEVEMVALPDVGLDDPPAADHAAPDRCGHRNGSASSFGIRMRL